MDCILFVIILNFIFTPLIVTKILEIKILALKKVTKANFQILTDYVIRYKNLSFFFKCDPK